MELEVTVAPPQNGEGGTATLIEDEDDPSLIIPITSNGKDGEDFIEVFPEEIPETKSSRLLQVMKDEDADLSVWADAALHYVKHKQHAQDSAQILEAACEKAETATKDDRVRIFAATGIAHLTASQEVSEKETGMREDLITKAENRFTQSSGVDNLYPMTWMGRGMLDLSANRLDQARFFFDTTLKECGKVLPALLGLAAVNYLEKKYEGAQSMYAQAIRLFPSKSGSATRVGFGLACYRLGQVDRAKAAFKRAIDIDPENVEAMVGAAVLDMMNLDETSNDFNSYMEKAIKMMSMANLLDHSNAMVQNHLANHYFWKWTPIAGTVEVTQGSKTVKGSQPIPLDEGDRVRIGMEYETYVAEDDDAEDEEGLIFQMKESWKGESTGGLKVWKKDYDRVIALAKGAYNSTSVDEIKAESLFFLGRVYHVREMMEEAGKVYNKSCELNPNLEPARFGLAQVLIHRGEYEQAMAHLQLVLGTSTTATDALATLGLLEVKMGKSAKKTEDGFLRLRKAIDLDPLNHNLILLEALALQQHESTFDNALERYNKATDLMRRQGTKISFDLHTNIGVLSHETRKFEESLKCYVRALDALDEEGGKREARLENLGIEGGTIRHEDNDMFFGYVDSTLKIENPAKDEEVKEGVTSLKIRESGGKDASDLPIKIGDEIRLGESFKSRVSGIEIDEMGLVLRIDDAYVGERKKEANKEIKNEEESKLEDLKEKEDIEVVVDVSVFAKRENSRLEDSHAISIAFNLARLHETAGRTLAAIELHKAILKRNPAYVNSYLRLACISIDCGALDQCAGWLKIAAEVAPGNAEVLTLIGNLHLSLCDWQPAQQIFEGLLGKKIPEVEAYALLGVGNIYFANLDIPKRYAKHLGYAGDYYKRILTKDDANAYAANGLGTVFAEKGELSTAKDIFNSVRQVTSDAHLNLAHIYLAQSKHPEALQYYQSYLRRTEDGTTPITSKSRLDDKVDVLHYIAFAYFDWARQAERYNNARAAPADERYKKAMEHIELALIDNTSESKNGLLTYNLCMTKLQAANCVLQKVTRNIRRTPLEVEEALKGLQHSLETVETILKNKNEGAKVLISTSILNDFITHCKSNIESAKSHLEDDRKREEDANEIRELQRMNAETKREEQRLQKELEMQEESRRQEELDRRAREKMRLVEDLRTGWEQEQAKATAAAEKRNQNKAPPAPDFIDNSNELEEDREDEPPPPRTAGLFEDSSDDEDAPTKKEEVDEETKEIAAKTTQQDLFGDSSDEESDEELRPTSGKKRSNEDSDDDEEPVAKKAKAVDLEDAK